jgi:hypothetical protein
MVDLMSTCTKLQNGLSACLKRSARTYLFHKGLIQIVGPSNTEVDNIHPGRHGVVEGVQKPGGIRHLHSAFVNWSLSITARICHTTDTWRNTGTAAVFMYMLYADNAVMEGMGQQIRIVSIPK